MCVSRLASSMLFPRVCRALRRAGPIPVPGPPYKKRPPRRLGDGREYNEGPVPGDRFGNSGRGSGQYMAMLQMRTDAEAIAASRMDPERFADIFDRHFEPIHRYLHRRVGRELADDLAAETFAEAFRQRSRYDGSADARPWLFGIATNLLRRHHRTERRQLLAYSRSRVEPAYDGFDDADARLDALALRRSLSLALSTLRDADRDVL